MCPSEVLLFFSFFFFWASFVYLPCTRGAPPSLCLASLIYSWLPIKKMICLFGIGQEQDSQFC